MERVSFIVVSPDGAIQMRGECPPEMLHEYDGGRAARVVVLRAGAPLGDWRIDMRRLRRDPDHRHDFHAIAVTRKIGRAEAAMRVVIARLEAVELIDRHFAGLLTGPLADVHARKRRQAEASGGTLVDGDADRMAILARAAEQDERLAALDRQRRALKADVREAETLEAVQVVLSKLN